MYVDDELGADGQPAPKKGWSAAGEMVTGNVSKIVSLQATFAEPEAYTIQFNLQIRPGQANINPVAVRAQAKITWSVEGNETTRIVDVGDGVSISGTGQAVRVVVTDITDLNPASVGKFYNVAILVAPGTRPDTGQPPTLAPFPRVDVAGIQLLQNLGPGMTSALIPIPDGAGVVSVMVVIADGAGQSIPEQNIQVLQTVGGGTVKSYDPRCGGFVPTGPGVNGIYITNWSATQTIQFSLLFGVDG